MSTLGGHTSEMLSMLCGIDLKTFSPRHYIISNTDKIGESKITDFEKNEVFDFLISLNSFEILLFENVFFEEIRFGFCGS
jgi:hypothetical protein